MLHGTFFAQLKGHNMFQKRLSGKYCKLSISHYLIQKQYTVLISW